MMTLEEYKKEKNEADKKVLEILADDTAETVVYDLHRYDRREGCHAVSLGIFKKYENLRKAMDAEIEFLEAENEGEYHKSDYTWFETNKYCLKNGEYENILSCRMTFDGKLLHYLPIGDALKDIEIPLSHDVIKAYSTGDILKVKNIPLSEDFYVIYIYDEERQGNKHIQMCFDEEISFCKIHWMEITEKV